MGTKFRANGNIGRVAIYEDSDDAPWDFPLAHPSRVRFHSGLAYPARIATISGTLSLPGRQQSAFPMGFGFVGHVLGAHNRPGIPMIEGKWLAAGDGAVDLPAIGSVPVQWQSGIGGIPQTSGTTVQTTGSTSGCWRWLTIGANATNILVHEGYAAPVTPYFLPAMSINYEIHILDKILV